MVPHFVFYVNVSLTEEFPNGFKSTTSKPTHQTFGKKIRQFTAKGQSTEKKLEELGFAKGGTRPEFRTGRDADPRVKKNTI